MRKLHSEQKLKLIVHVLPLLFTFIPCSPLLRSSPAASPSVMTMRAFCMKFCFFISSVAADQPPEAFSSFMNRANAEQIYFQIIGFLIVALPCLKGRPAVFNKCCNQSETLCYLYDIDRTPCVKLILRSSISNLLFP